MAQKETLGLVIIAIDMGQRKVSISAVRRKYCNSIIVYSFTSEMIILESVFRENNTRRKNMPDAHDDSYFFLHKSRGLPY